MSRDGNPFDGLHPRAALDAFLNSRCPHGYSKRKHCSTCQAATRERAEDPVVRDRERRPSVYEDRRA
jgi:hypothetical protein